jgi:hypothetical protein
MSRRRNRSLGTLEVLRRQVQSAPDLDGHPEERANLLTRIRGFQRLRLDPDGDDVAVGLVWVRRALLVTLPTLRGADSVTALVRLTEQLAKALRLMERARFARGRWQVPRRPDPVPRRPDVDDVADEPVGAARAADRQDT